MIDETRFRAMGCDAHLIVVGGTASLAAEAVRRIEELEACWSRFRPASELSRLNRACGAPSLVSDDLFTLVEHAVRAWEWTGGRYDPTVHDSLTALGYDRDFAELTRGRFPRAATPTRAPGCASVRLDPYLPAVTLGPDVHLDPGGIGKGLAADIVVGELIERGAHGAMVNLGGDVSVAGAAPTQAGWIVGVEDPRDRTRSVARVALRAGGVCTSSRLRRAWIDTSGMPVHHLVDPRTGMPVDTDVASVTVVAGAAWWAEALTKARFVGTVAGSPDHLSAGTHALLVSLDGRVTVEGDAGVFGVAESVVGTTSR